MPISAKSPARKITDIVENIDATAMDVCHAGDQCALTFYTRGGIVRICLPLHAFVEKARAPRDANGNPFPVSALNRFELIQGELERDAEQSRAVPASIPPVVPGRQGGPRRKLPPGVREKYLAVYVETRRSVESAKVICARHDVPLYPWRTWSARHRPECEAALAAARLPITKPGSRFSHPAYE